MWRNWVAVKSRWTLSVDRAELRALTRPLDSECASVKVAKPTEPVLSQLIARSDSAGSATPRSSEQSIGRWKADFLEAGEAALVVGKPGPTSREEQLEAEVAELTTALGEAAIEVRVWKKSAVGRLGPSRASR